MRPDENATSATSFGGGETRWHKLRAMSGAEVRERATQALGHRWDAVRGRVGGVPVPAVEHEASRRQASFFFDADDIPALVELFRQRLPAEAASLIDRADRICEHRLRLLGYPELSLGAEIDWHRDPVNGRRAPLRSCHKIPLGDFEQVGDPKVTWELNRHQHLAVLARAYRLTDNPAYVDEIREQLEDWTRGNPYPFGINWASALEAAFRSLSWLWVRHLLPGSDAAHTELNEVIVRGLSVHGRHLERYLSTYSSPNTHLLGEAVGLFAIGTLVPEISEGSRWMDLGWRIIRREADRQVLADGMHFEKSTHYHVYALDFFLYARVLADRNRLDGVNELDRSLVRQLGALSTLARTGVPVRFGDDDGGRVFDGYRNHIEHLLDPLATGAALYGRADLKALAGDLREETIWLLGAEGATRFDELAEVPRKTGAEALDASHIYFLSAGDDRRVAISAGSWGGLSGGHGHADLLGLQFVSGDRVLLDDPGTFTYTGSGGERDRFRLSDAHNTLTVDGLSQAEPRGPFKWSTLPAAKVDAWVVGEAFSLFVGSHAAYTTPDARRVHRRWVLALETTGLVIVRDEVEGSGSPRLDVHWHLGTGATLQCARETASVLQTNGEAALALVRPDDSGWSAREEAAWGAPVYGSREQRAVLRVSTRSPLPAELLTVLQPLSAQRPEVGKLRRLSNPEAEGDRIRAYAFDVGDVVHEVFFREGMHEWRCGDWHSDARLLYCRIDGTADRVEETVMVGGSYATRRGQEVARAATSTTAGGTYPFVEWQRRDAGSGGA